MHAHSKVGQRGISLVGLIFVLAILAMIGVLALKVVPTVTEFMSIKKAIIVAKAAGQSIPEIRASFDKQADVGYIESIAGKDLDIVKTADGFEISFAYEKKIPLVGPASLALDYQGSTAAGKPGKAGPGD
jgi:type II secretory pathway pseudopilin PulG